MTTPPRTWRCIGCGRLDEGRDPGNRLPDGWAHVVLPPLETGRSARLLCLGCRCAVERVLRERAAAVIAVSARGDA